MHLSFFKKYDSFKRVVDTKIRGLVNLDHVTQKEKLDFFVAFSSIASIMPSQGQCDYAAANSFLNEYCEYRNSQKAKGNRFGVSVALNWPLWEEGGLHVNAQEEKHLYSVFGMTPLKKETGLLAFENGLAYCETNGIL